MIPTVSVIMSVFNAEKYLDEAILSILNQTFRDFEFIIINDGSNDKSLDIIKRYKAIDDRIILINRENKGLIFSLNEAIVSSKGIYIARMDADDISYPERIQKQVEFLVSNPDIDLCGSWIRVFNEKGISRLHKYPHHDLTIKAKMLFENPIAHPSVMYKKSFLNEYASYKDIEDYATWLFLAPSSHFSNLQIPLLHYREHSENTCKRNNTQRESYVRLIHNFVQYHHIPIKIPEEHINVYFCQDRSFDNWELTTLELFYRDILNYVYLNYLELYRPLKIAILIKLCKLYLKNIRSIRLSNFISFIKLLRNTNK